MPDVEPTNDASKSTFTSPDLSAPESDAAPEAGPESPERSAATLRALTELLDATADYTHRNNRKIVRSVTKRSDHPADAGQMYETTERLNGVEDELRTLDLRTFVPDSNTAYHLSLSFHPDRPESVMLGLETPLDKQGSPWGTNFKVTADAGVAGFAIEDRRLQDYLYAPGAASVPVREGDYSYIYDYRPTTPGRTRTATKAELDVVLGLLADSTVMNGDKRVGKAVEMVPALAELTTAA